jgi:NitT/TauT family transport system substrate-binding protein
MFQPTAISRRSLLGAALAAPTLLLSSHARAAAQPVRLQLCWLKNVEFGNAWIAQKAGLFAQRGLDVSLLAGGPQVDPIALLASGAVDVALSSSVLPILAAAARGVPVVVLGAIFQTSRLGLAARADRHIELPSDLKGARIGYQQVNRSLYRAILAANAVPEDRVTTTVVTADPGMLIQGRIDLMTVSVLNVPLAMAAAGVPAQSWVASQLGMPMQGDVICCLAGTLAKRRQMVVGVLGALAEGTARLIAQPEAIARDVVANFGEGLQDAHQIAYARAQAPLMTSKATATEGLLRLDRGAWEASNKAAVATGVIDAPVDLNALLQPSALIEAKAPNV